MPTKKVANGNPKPVHYRGGVIYTSWVTKKFRALKIRGDKWSEKSCGWGGSSVPTKSAWKDAVGAIDSHNDK